MSSLISWRNWIDTAASITPTYGGLTNTVDPGFPMSNLQVRQLAKVARQTTAAEFRMTTDLGAARPIRVFGLLGLRGRRYTPGDGLNGFSITIQASTVSNFATTVWSQTVASLMWSAPLAPMNIILVPPAGLVTARYVRAFASWVRPVGDTFVDVGRAWIGDGLDITDEIDDGGGSDFLDMGTIDESKGNQAYEQPGSRPRTLDLSVNCDTLMAYGFADKATNPTSDPCLQALRLEAGTTGSVLAIEQAQTQVLIQSTAIYGRLDRPFRIQRIKGSVRRYAATIIVREEA